MIDLDWPSPIAHALRQYQEELNAFVQLHRLIDAFEVLLKYATVMAIQNFYAVGLEGELPTTDSKIRAGLYRPSLGDWDGLLREVLRGFGGYPDRLFSQELYFFRFANFGPKPSPQKHFSSSGASARLLRLRNSLAHGATLTEQDAHKRLIDHQADLELMFSTAEFLKQLTLAQVSSSPSGREVLLRPLMGLMESSETLLVRSIESVTSAVGHVVAYNSQSQRCLDLHPLVVYCPCNEQVGQWDEHRHLVGTSSCGQRKVLFYNDLSSDTRAFFLDYWQGHRSEFRNPDPLPSDLRTRVQSAKDSPLRSADPAENLVEQLVEHFVGREQELEDITTFVRSGRQQALVVVGHPGIGKSALLARWSQLHRAARHFVREGDCATVEPRLVFENLARQIRDIHEGHWQRPSEETVGEYRRAFEQLLAEVAHRSSDPIVVILDGLDEAIAASATRSPEDQVGLIDWLPTPAMLPPTCRLILSTRLSTTQTLAFAAKFGRDKAQWLELGKLTDADIRGLLFQVHNKYAVLADQSYVDAIEKRSEGSPLYLRMLLADLLDRRAVFGDVVGLPLGLMDYYDRILGRIRDADLRRTQLGADAQLQVQTAVIDDLYARGVLTAQQRDDETQRQQEYLAGVQPWKAVDLLALYALTKEPLSLREAENMLGWTSDQIHQAYTDISSVLVEASYQHFSPFHSSFRDYILRMDSYHPTGLHLLESTIQRVLDRVLNYCEAKKEDPTSYVVRWYASHLADAKEWTALHDLLLTGMEQQHWAATHYRLQGSYIGYLHDLQVLWTYAEHENLLITQIQCSVVAASIGARSMIPPELLVQLLVVGTPDGRWTWEAILGHIATLTDDKQKSSTIRFVAQHAPDPPVMELLNICRDIVGEEHRALALIILINLVPDSLLPLWEEVARTITQLNWSVPLQSWLATRLPEDTAIERWSDVLRLARAIPEAGDRAECLFGLSNSFADEGAGVLWREVLAALNELDAPWERAQRLERMVRTEGLPDERRVPVAEAALDVAEEMQDSDERSIFMQKLVALLPECLLERACALVLDWPVEPEDGLSKYNPRGRNQRRVLEELAPCLSVSFCRQMICSAISLLEQNDEYVEWLFPLLSHLAYLGQFVDVWDGLRYITDERVQSALLQKVAPYLDDQALVRALGLAKSMEDVGNREGALAALAVTAARLGEPELGFRLAVSLEGVSERARCLAGMASYLSGDPLTAAIAAVNQLANTDDGDSDSPRRTALAGLVPQLAAVGRVQDALQLAATSLKANHDLLEALSQNQSGILDSQMAEGLGLLLRWRTDVPWRIETYVGMSARIAEWLPLSMRCVVLQKALALVRRVPIAPRPAEIGPNRRDLLGYLSPMLTAPLLEEACAIARYNDDEDQQWHVISRLFPYLSAEVQQAILTDITVLDLTPNIALALADLAAHLPSSILHRLYVFSQEEEDEDCTPLILTKMAPFLDSAARSEAINRVTHVTMPFGESAVQKWLDALDSVAPHLLAHDLEAMVARVEHLEAESAFAWIRERALVKLARHAGRATSDKVLGIIVEWVRMADWPPESGVLGVVSVLGQSPSASAKAIYESLGAEQAVACSQLLADLCPQLEDAMCQSLVEHLVEQILSLGPEDSWCKTLLGASLAKWLPCEKRAELLQWLLPQILATEYPAVRVRSIAAIAEYVPESELVDLVRNGVEAALDILKPATSLDRAAMDHQTSGAQGDPEWGLELLCPALTMLGAASRRQAFCLILRRASRLGRSTLLRALGAVVPAVAETGGQEVVMALYDNLKDTARWWP